LQERAVNSSVGVVAVAHSSDASAMVVAVSRAFRVSTIHPLETKLTEAGSIHTCTLSVAVVGASLQRAIRALPFRKAHTLSLCSVANSMSGTLIGACQAFAVNSGKLGVTDTFTTAGITNTIAAAVVGALSDLACHSRVLSKAGTGAIILAGPLPVAMVWTDSGGTVLS